MKKIYEIILGIFLGIVGGLALAAILMWYYDQNVKVLK